MSTVHVVESKAVGHWLGVLRDKKTPPALFRQAAELITQSVFQAASAEFELICEVRESPCGNFDWWRWKNPIALIPILRAGLGMVDPILEWVPDATILHLGAARDHDSLQPYFYYDKLPDSVSEQHCLVLDPMLATAGSAMETIRRLKAKNARKVTFLGLIGSRVGVENLAREFPEVKVYLGALDQTLNSNGYIVPGLGDAGDRYFFT